MRLLPSKLGKISSFTLLLVATLFCTSGLNATAQDQTAPTNNTDTHNNKDTGKTASAPETGPSSPRSEDRSLQLGVGDLLEMSVYGVPDLSIKTRISSNGEMYCPLIGYTHVAGLTAQEAEELIQTRLSAFVKNPQVALLVTEYASEGASVLGAVARPGVYPVLGQQRLFDLISAAGGLSDKAGRSLTVTHRSDPDKTITVDLSRNLKDNPETNVQVFPGDTIIVQKADIIYVVGDVAKPSGFLMEGGGLTVLQAVALAGGTTRTAKLGGAKILRKTAGGGMTETPVELKKILQAKAPDLPLQADDILVVPSSTGKVIAGATLQAALQAATLLSVAAVP
jgi:polysaccharide biosynthesis/export protein